MTRRLISHDPISGIRAYYEPENHGGARIIHEYDDVSGILDNNKLNYNHGNGWNADRSFHKVATIPNVVITKWKLEKGIDVFNKDHWPKVKQLLNDPEWRYLRTSPGVL